MKKKVITTGTGYWQIACGPAESPKKTLHLLHGGKTSHPVTNSGNGSIMMHRNGQRSKKKYTSELTGNKSKLEELLKDLDRRRRLTLLYGTKEKDHNQAVVLKEFIESMDT